MYEVYFNGGIYPDAEFETLEEARQHLFEYGWGGGGISGPNDFFETNEIAFDG